MHSRVNEVYGANNAYPALDEHQVGFIVTDSALPETVLQGSRQMLNRRPLPFETSLPGVFAVGEGASAVRSVHQALAR